MWVTAQRTNQRASTIDAQLQSNAGRGRAHYSRHIRAQTYSGDWNWDEHKADCGARVRAGDDTDVMVFDVVSEPPPNACKRCVAKRRVQLRARMKFLRKELAKSKRWGGHNDAHWNRHIDNVMLMIAKLAS